MIVVSLCDMTGHWPQPFTEYGYEVVSYDLQTTGHDIRLFTLTDLPPADQVVGVLAAPPCTVFANSGARWHRSDDDMREGLSVVDACLRIITTLQPDWWALENPIGKLNRYLGKPRMYFNPCDYAGHLPEAEREREAYTKRTALWGRFNTSLRLAPVDPIHGSKMHLRYGGKSMRTKNARSATPIGFAKAFAAAQTNSNY